MYSRSSVHFNVYSNKYLLPNHYFQFKEFIVYQDKCAMKVCTDSCLFGAWLHHWIAASNIAPKNALDIGAGTGLLSLMVAQGNKQLAIDAIELEEDAFLQAVENVAASNFAAQITLHHTSLQAFRNERKYDFIFSNPPFFENDLLAASQSKNMAKHDTSLTLQVLIEFIQEQLTATGSAALLIPHQRFATLAEIITQAGLHINQIVHVRQTPKHSFFRTMLLFSGMASLNEATTSLSVKDEENNYSKSFTALLQPFYLHM